MKNIFSLAIAMLFAFAIQAQTNYAWTGAANADWATSTNWSPNGVPDSLDNITINSTGSGTPQLSANAKVNNITMSAKTINLAGYNLKIKGTTSLTGGTIGTGSGSVTFSNSTTTLSGTAFNADVYITAANVAVSGTTFDKPVHITKTGSSADGWGGGNTFNSTLDFTSTGSGNSSLNWTSTNYYNDNVTFSNTGSGIIKLAESTGNSYIGTGKTITVGSSGFSSGQLYLNRLIQNSSDTTAQSLTFTGSASLYVNNTTLYGRLTYTGPNVYLNASTFAKAVVLNKNGSATNQWNGGNTYNSTFELNLTAGSADLNWDQVNTYNGNITFTNTSSGTIKLTASTGISTLASGKTVNIGGAGFASGNLYLNRLTAASAQNITLTGSASLYVNNATLNGTFDFTGPNVYLNASTFNGAVTITKNGSGSNAANGGCTFNYPLTLSLSAGSIDLNWDQVNYFNDNVTFNNTGSGQIRLSAYTGTSILASGKTITAGTFSSGTLNLNRLTQTGTTAQSLTLTSSATLYLSTASTFNAAVTVSSPNVIIEGATFNGDLTVTKTSSSTNYWGANTYNGTTSITNNGTGYLNLSYSSTGGDIYNGNVSFTKASTGDILLGTYATTVTFKRNVTLSGITSTQFTGSQMAVFAGNNNQTLSNNSAITWGNVKIDKDSSHKTLTLSTPLNINTALTLTKGRVITTATNVLNFAHGSSVSGTSDNCFVKGPVSKTGNASFTFPTGKGNLYRPISISAPSSSASVFTAEYINEQQTQGTNADTTFSNLSNCEHWTLTRSGSSSNVNVTLSWRSASCNATKPDSMRVASWNGTKWQDLGNGSRTGNNFIGTVTNGTTPSNYADFTLATNHNTSFGWTFETNVNCAYIEEGLSLTGGGSLPNAESKYGYFWSPSGIFRVLLVFVELNYDDYPDSDPYPNGTCSWAKGAMPNFANDIFEKDIVANPNAIVTKFFEEASFNNFHLLGDYVDHLYTYNTSDFIYDPTNSNTSDFEYNPTTNKYTLKENSIRLKLISDPAFISAVTANGLLPEQFDLWTPQPYSDHGQPKDNVPNSNYDHVMIISRNRVAKAAGGASYSPMWASLNGPISNTVYYAMINGKGTDSYSDFSAGGGFPFTLLRHEFCHEIFGANNFHAGGGYGAGVGFFIPDQGGWSIMGGANTSLMTCNAWDRDRLDWKGPGKSMTISGRNADNISEINTDLDGTNLSQQGYYVLRDFVTTGDALRIKLPNIPGNEYPQYLWIENHQTQENNGSQFDTYQFNFLTPQIELEPNWWCAPELCTDLPTPGIYSYIQVQKDTKIGSSDEVFTEGYLPNNSNRVYDRGADYLRFMPASGRHDFEYYSIEPNDNCVNDDPQKPFEKVNINPLSGSEDTERVFDDYDGDGTADGSLEEHLPWLEKIGVGYSTKMQMFGDADDAFTLNGNNKIGIGTNPPSSSIMSKLSAGGTAYPFPAFAPNSPSAYVNNRKVYLNNISVEIVEENVDMSGAIKVKVLFNDNAIDNDIRWCGNDIIVPPSVSGQTYSVVLKENKTITLAQSITANDVGSPITLANGRKVLAQRTKLICTENSAFNMESNSTINITNESMFFVKNGALLNLGHESQINIEDSCTLSIEGDGYLSMPNGGIIRVKSGGTLHIKSDAFVNLNNNSQIIVEDGGYICIEPGANINLQHITSKIIYESGYHTGLSPNAIVYNSLNPSPTCTGDLCEVVITGNGMLEDFSYTDLGSVTINTNQTYNSVNRSFQGNLIISGGATVTFNSSTLSFNERSKIIVMPGSKLVIDDNTVLKNHSCNYYWQGVEVWGTYNQDQTSPYQGIVEVKGGSTIENAVVGINAIRTYDNATPTGSLTSTSWQYTGGIISVNGAVFKNNAQAINIHSYHRPLLSNGVEPPNKCSIKNSVFTYDDNLIISNTIKPYAHIGVYDIKRLLVTGNQFKNELTDDAPLLDFSSGHRGFGIWATDMSGLKVTDCTTLLCTGTGTPNTFEEMPFGIYLLNTNGSNTVSATIENNNFNDNLWGIRMYGANPNRIIKNEFNISTELAGNGVGVGMIQTPNYRIEENDFIFYGTGSNSETYGTYAYNTGKENNLVYKNEYVELQRGNYAYGGNKNLVIEGGLQYKCNTNIDNLNDIDVVPDAYPGNGISQVQGGDQNQNSPASNLFSQNSDPSLLDFQNTGGFIRYYMNDLTTSPQEVEPLDYSSSIQINPPTDWQYSSSSCPSNLYTNKATLHGLLTTNNQLLGPKRVMLDTLTDDGDTESILNRIDTTMSATGLRSYLLSASPWLSYDALIQVAINDVMNNAQVRDVLVANPHSGRLQQIIDTLADRKIPMPDSLIQQVIDSAYVTTPRDTLVANILFLATERRQLIQDLIYLHAEDTTYNGLDSAIVLLLPEDELWADYLLVNCYVDNRQNTEAIDLLDSLPGKYNLKGIDLSNYTDYRYIMGKADSLGAFKNTYLWHNLDSVNIINLESIASSNAYWPGAQACNILMFIGKDTCTFTMPGEEAYRRSNVPNNYTRSATQNMPVENSRENIFKLFPNPAQGSITILYNFNTVNGNSLVLELHNMFGQVVLKQNLYAPAGSTQLDISALSRGVYIATIKNGTIMLKAEKLIAN